MSEEQVPRKKNPFFTALKIIFYAGAFLFVFFTILANMGGSGDVYKNALEDYISEETGYQAHIRTLNRMSFFPAIGFEFQGLELRDPDSGGNIVAILDKAILGVGFWDVMRATGKFRNLYMEELVADAGTFLSEPVHIARLEITDPQGPAPYLQFTGHVGEKEADGRVRLDSYGKQGRKSFRLAQTRDFSLHFGAASLSGVQKMTNKGFILEDLKISLSGKDAATARADLSKNAAEGIKLQGQVVFPENGSAFDADLILKFAKPGVSVSGEIKGSTFADADFSKASRLGQFVDYLHPLLGGKEGIDIPVEKMDVTVTLPALEKKIILDHVRVNIGPGDAYAASFKIAPAQASPQTP